MMDGRVNERQKEAQVRHACLIPFVCVLLLLGGGEDRISPSQLREGLMTARKPPVHHRLQSPEQERTLESWNICFKQNPIIEATPFLQGDVKAGQVQLLPPIHHGND